MSADPARPSPASQPLIIDLGEARVRVAPGAWVAPGASVLGDVELGSGVSVWYGAVVRADGAAIIVGDGSNIQDGAVLHSDPDLPVTVGRGVTIGHRAVVHGSLIGDDVLIGMGAVLLNGASVGPGSLVAAGTLVREGARIPAGSLVVGSPGVVRRQVSDAELAAIRRNSRAYQELAERHARALEA